ncbi:MAG: DUF177 domain-containing protein [Halanaerobiaceae bacterium]|jgi:uncharacterized protein|nr:DUF177 domain-containing protein [Halanaerobiaceae bacterium]
MNLDLSNLKEIGSSISIKKKVSLPAFKNYNQDIETPYLFDLELEIYNTDDYYVLNGSLAGTLIMFCSRCLEKFEYPIDVQIEEELAKKEIENPERINLNEIIMENIILSLPMKYLCSADCRGLCSNCGQNLNTGECDCDNTIIDPRLAKLKEFYKTDDNEE